MLKTQVHIREHLVPFLYQEFDGVERVFSGRKVKVVRITNKSSLGKWLTAMLEHTNKEIKVSNYNIYLSIDDREHRLARFGTFYINYRSSTKALELTDDHNDILNELLEDMFRISIYYFVSSYQIFYKKRGGVLEGIREYMSAYNLHEHFSEQSIRMLYYRAKESPKLRRIQTQVANRVTNYY